MTDRPTYLLGIHDGHNCGATLTRGGEILASISEERLTRNKNEVGYPRQSIEAVLRIGRIEASELSGVVYASLFMHARNYLEDVSGWYAVGLGQQIADDNKDKSYAKAIFQQRRSERIEDVTRHLGVRESDVHFIEHHTAHLTSALYTSPFTRPNTPILGLTCDGAGDGLCATVSICKGSQIERIAETRRDASLGKIYSRVTFMMGMKPWEHEYKLMGLAPYADPEFSDRAAQPLRQLLGFSDNGLNFVTKTELRTNYCYEYLKRNFERVRFDAIAGATQLFTEEMLVNWVRNCIRHTGIPDIVCGGGVFMNVKANMLLAQLPEVRSIYVMPSCADESLSVGAALGHYYAVSSNKTFQSSELRHLYLGGTDDESAESSAVNQARADNPIAVSKPASMTGAIADLLSSGGIIAVCRGRMEWGARALGNRSILASGDDFRRVAVINDMIKMRDFWMPFAPSIRKESSKKYFDLGKDIEPRFMTFAAPINPECASDLAAASHPKDHTIRPQVVSEDANPDYHAILTAFEKKTGRGGLLNTSFNLHGEPIVATSKDAIRVFLKSGLRHLALNNHILSKETAAV